MANWWQLEIEEATKALEADLTKGLSSDEAELRLEKFGANQLEEKKGISPLSIFIEQFKDFIIWVLIAAAIISGLMGEWIDTLAIIAIVILNSILGFIQEYRAEKSLAALKKLSSPTSKVIRDEQHSVIESSQIVPGDLIELESGDNIPADSRLVWITSNFNIQEASLTGESTPVAKNVTVLKRETIPLADRINMVYMGTFVTHGKARAIVAETGMKTELGRITGMIQDIEQESTPLQKKLEQFGKWIVYFCFVVVGLVFVLSLIRSRAALNILRSGDIMGILHSKDISEIFLTAVSLAVAAIPEGLPAVVTIALALGVQRMVQRHALIRKLPSVETLGCVTVICSDKTGTLTKNEMTVKSVFAGNNLFEVTGIGYEPKGEFLLNKTSINISDYPDLSKTLLCGVLCNGAALIEENGVYKIFGDPTEGSILTSAAKIDIWKDRLEDDFIFVEEIAFDSERKKMTIIRQNGNKFIAYVKGAPDILLNDCSRIEEKGNQKSLNSEDRQNILKANSDLANQAMRVLAVAYREFDSMPEKFDVETIEQDLIFLGLIAMIDPPREEVKDAIDKCKTAGIKTVMITGDHKSTAVAIARELGFYQEDSIALTGEELDRLSDEEFEKEIEHIPVYARVSPENKLRIVRTRRKVGEIVAMTGDGVNDAPAVKEADIGVAMGITGTDVTKEVSDMVVTDDNFASIVAAVEEGRGIYDNIKKFIHYLLSCNAGEILVMFTASLFGWASPLIAIQILWVNLVTDGLPALALGVDPVEPNIMKRSPRPSDESVLTKHGGMLLVAQGAFIAFCCLLAYNLSLYFVPQPVDNPKHARTVAFIVLAVSQLFHSYNCRSNRESLFKLGLFSNKKLIYATGISFLLQMAVIYMPFFQPIFKTVMLKPLELGMVIVISSFPLWAMEITKAIIRAKSRDNRNNHGS
jgi:Ca2+-transporting ATPase